MLEEIAQSLREYKGDDTLDITADTTFADLNLDSLDTVEMVMNLEEKYGVSIEMNGDINSVGELIKAIEKAQQ
ncbi:MAG: acyl carrier protein [Propionibacteriaceae bacterium]|jgi:acyl carrier protein|nr:acyl carrier protein [Propionibacteriaceae bacterium]